MAPDRARGACVVSRRHAIHDCPGALREETARGKAPLFCWAKNARRIGICREAVTTTWTAPARLGAEHFSAEPSPREPSRLPNHR